MFVLETGVETLNDYYIYVNQFAVFVIVVFIGVMKI